MKILRKIIALALVTLSGSFVYAQTAGGTPSDWEYEHKLEIKNTDYIFMGTVKQETYYHDKNEAVSTVVIDISKIYKGSPQLKLGTIEVVTGQNPIHHGVISRSSEGRIVRISKAGTYIIFCRTADTSWLVDSTLTDNSITLTIWGMAEAIIINPIKNTESWYGTPQYKTLQDVEGFFKKNDLTVQEEVQQK